MTHVGGQQIRMIRCDFGRVGVANPRLRRVHIGRGNTKTWMVDDRRIGVDRLIVDVCSAVEMPVYGRR